MPARETRFRELDITAQRIVDPAGPPDFSRRRPDGIDLAAENEILDLLLDLVVELVAVVPEKLDAVIFVRIVRRGEDDAGIGAQGTGDVSHAGRRQRTDQQTSTPSEVMPATSAFSSM